MNLCFECSIQCDSRKSSPCPLTPAQIRRSQILVSEHNDWAYLSVRKGKLLAHLTFGPKMTDLKVFKILEDGKLEAWATRV